MIMKAYPVRHWFSLHDHGASRLDELVRLLEELPLDVVRVSKGDQTGLASAVEVDAVSLDVEIAKHGEYLIEYVAV